MPSILNRIPKIPLLHFENPTVKRWVFSGFWPISVRIDGINRRMRLKNKKMVVWGAKIYLTQLLIISVRNYYYYFLKREKILK
jgi:hypothetical protein